MAESSPEGGMAGAKCQQSGRIRKQKPRMFPYVQNSNHALRKRQPINKDHKTETLISKTPRNLIKACPHPHISPTATYPLSSAFSLSRFPSFASTVTSQ
jgi:hypothetical protein